MDKIVMNNKEWYSIIDFMNKYNIKSNATVYAMVKDKRALASWFMGKRIFAMN